MPNTTTRRRPGGTAKPKAVAAPAVINEDGAEIDEPGLLQHTVLFSRDGEVEEHVFNARPEMSYKRMQDIVRARRSGDGVDALAIFERMIRPSMIDTDGTPAKWKPEIEDGMFVDPHGDERPVSELADMTAFEAGSSRRRWIYLIDVDDELDVKLPEIEKLYEALVEASAARPT